MKRREEKTYAAAAAAATLPDSLEIEERLEPFFKADFIRLIKFDPLSLSSPILVRPGWLDIFKSFGYRSNGCVTNDKKTMSCLGEEICCPTLESPHTICNEGTHRKCRIRLTGRMKVGRRTGSGKREK